MLNNNALAKFMMGEEQENGQPKKSSTLGSDETSIPAEVNHYEHNTNDYEDFKLLCEQIHKHFQEFELKASDDVLSDSITRLEDALLGKPEAVSYYYSQIRSYLKSENKSHIEFPPWYDDLVEAVFHEVWGFAGIWEWIKHGESSSCKIIQPRIYFMENGKTVLKPQTISAERFKTLKRRLLINDKSQKENTEYQEIYMVDGTRIEIYNNHKKSSGEGVIVFRRYTLEEYSFEKLADLKTIDQESIPLLEAMVSCGFNTVILGPVRSGKTGFLATYQMYEDPELEGVLIETDPEIPLHKMMPNAPIMQLIADDEKLENLVKPLVRSDADYLLQGEARDGRALRLMLMLTKKGTRRTKGTFHTSKPYNFCYDAAQEIVNIHGGSIWAYMIQFAENFNFLFEMSSDSRDARIKRLIGIHELQFDPDTLEIRTNTICHFDRVSEKWTYNANLSEKTRDDGVRVSIDNFNKFEKELIRLAELYPMEVNPIKVSPFSKLIGK
ncbi:ATPase [Butyricicoccus sp. 1XD8-22]|nr:ATPase [Butyricicoccus sp. 1XD8-22]